jgi:hypothetical protein
MIDLLLVELGTGADLVFNGYDLVGCTGVENQPYLAMFSDEDGSGDYWGNALLLADGVDNEFISQTEAALRKYALNSNGRLRIDAAINEDLQYLTQDVGGTTVTVNSVIASDNRLDVTINFNGQLFLMEWNPDELFLKYSI